jgi:formiminoglutamase
MTNLLELVTQPNPKLFFKRNDKNDVRLGEIVPNETYENAEIVILGCPQDEGVSRNKGRLGAKLAPDKIREQFYKLSNFGIKKKIHDLGNTIIGNTLEATHETQTKIVEQVLRDGKRLIILGGGNDISFADGLAMANVFEDNWIAINIDQHFDVRADEVRNSGTPYRQLLDGNFLKGENFYEVAYQTQANSPIYFDYLQKLGVNCLSIEQIRSNESIDEQLRESLKLKFIRQTSTLNTFFGFDMDAVRSSDAPGTSAPSPIGLRAGEFITLVKFAASLSNTKIIEFTEVNPTYDIDHRTTKLVAIAMHRFCSAK